MKPFINTSYTIALLIVFLVLQSNFINGQISKRIDSLALEYASRGFNGNLLYSKNDSIVFTGNYGYSNFDTKTPLNDSTVFELASVSKQFTALAIVQLIEKKLLNYDTKVIEIIINFPYKNITVEHLLRHQSGLPDYQKIFYDKTNWNRKKMAFNQNVINVIAKLKLNLEFEPGSKYKYNNTGYVILASIIEQVSRRSYQNYMTEYIFIPTGMLTSSVYNTQKEPKLNKNIARG